MSELKTNKIATNDANNVAIDNSLKLKNVTTTQRDLCLVQKLVIWYITQQQEQ